MPNKKVVAEIVGKYRLSFKCPYCRNCYKKNGEPYARSKAVYHTHGTGGLTAIKKYFTIERMAHCQEYGCNMLKREGYDGFEIEVNETTERVEFF